MDNILEIKLKKLAKEIGNTPSIDLGSNIFGKIEGANPAGSIKDRAAFYIIMRALEGGLLSVGGTVVEATSGNMGIGLAYVARELGLKSIMVMPESMTVERRAMIASYGAELALTAAREGMSGAVAKAKEICAETGAFFANQFGNFASVEAHFNTTAPEIFESHPNAKYIVCGIGSGGTAMGIKKYIVQHNLDCKVVAVEPLSSPLLSGGYAGSHKIQGIGANFVPELVDIDKLDKIMTVSDNDAISTVSEMFKEFGIKCGISSGAAYFAAKELRQTAEGEIVAIFPDDGNRYPGSLYII